ncbi:unnamed protein product [Lactuca saligna]|uniref:Protein kinase domain-containing protein n=1 Tax=Lactuca saligna TaxID=75948 RepID=A0AA35VFS9_LACSI|nr:unnamed protein product [Lactuca saligna]
MVANKMQQFQVLHLLILISLTTFTKAHNYIQPRCERSCGQASIRFPFGIGINCSLNEWFNIECNSQRAYLPALNNVEVLQGFGSLNFIVNVPMISDCKNPLQNSSLSLDLSTSPFRYSGNNNMLMVQGCGHADIIMENGSIVTGCSTTCRKDTVSNIKNCFGVGCCKITIPQDLRSFTLNRTGLERLDRDGTSCGSVFLAYDQYQDNNFGRLSIVQHHLFVPVSLSLKGNDTSVGCKNMCGNVSIRYPFGIGRSCSGNEWFTIDCNSSTPYLSALNNLELLDIKSERFTVNVPMISDCENPIQNSSLDLNRSPFYFSKNGNLFVVEGCGNGVIINENGDISGGCSTSCGNESVSERNNCFGIGCCETTMTYDLKSFTLNLTELVGSHAGNVSCSRSAFLVDKNSYMKGRFSSQSTVEDQSFVPVSLEWGYMDEGGNTKEDKKCIDCEARGGYCYINEGLDSDVTCLYENKISLGVILGVSISIGLLLLIVMGYALYKIIKKTKAKRRKQRFFKRNGGILLRQQQTTDISLVDKTILFTSNELDKATDNFNENRILGRGGQGTVYKGMLADGRIVAIKKSKVVDESQLEQFINEVVILSQVSHRNVVKLLGCCLETEVPLLVSEFISNGTLYDLIHDETGEFLFSLNMRLQIATEVAGALSYLHSATSIPIYHRDIKTTNILLDEKYRAKVSDFGTSRLVSIDQTHLTTLVKGTFGYLDPEYFQSSQFTEKSDVYSFGVVLLELLTREKPISLTRFGENRSLALHFMLAMEEGRAMSIFDASVVKEGSRYELLAIANLAMQCLNFSGRNRPTMKEVASELEGIRLSHVPSTDEPNFGHVKHYGEVALIYGESTSTSITFYHNPSQ